MGKGFNCHQILTDFLLNIVVKKQFNTCCNLLCRYLRKQRDGNVFGVFRITQHTACGMCSRRARRAGLEGSPQGWRAWVLVTKTGFLIIRITWFCLLYYNSPTSSHNILIFKQEYCFHIDNIDILHSILFGRSLNVTGQVDVAAPKGHPPAFYRPNSHPDDNPPRSRLICFFGQVSSVAIPSYHLPEGVL